MLSSNQIAGFFDHQCLWNETIIALDFLFKDSHQGKEMFKSTTVSWAGVFRSFAGFTCLGLENFDHKKISVGLLESSSNLEHI